MVGWHHPLSGRGCGQTPGDSGGQGGLACRSPWGHKEPDAAGSLGHRRKERVLELVSRKVFSESWPLWLFKSKRIKINKNSGPQ